ncbi:MAG: hypothetical protein ACC661_03690, partial [Verrucomicrobiales bacterium]
MPISSDEIRALTRARLPEFAACEFEVDQLAQDGSDRIYSRLRRCSGGRSVLLMEYGEDRAENRAFAPLTQYLRSRGVRCPEVYAHDEARRLVWIEDLGTTDLWSLRHEPWEGVRRPLYESALRQAAH